MDQSIWADPPPKAKDRTDNEQVPAREPIGETETPNPEPQIPLSSVAAPTFAPDELDTSVPPPSFSSADLFSSTGPQQDDLFDDVVPVESMRIRSDDDLFSDDFTPVPEPVVEQPTAQPRRGTGEGSRGRVRGRGRGRARGATHDERAHRSETQAEPRAKDSVRKSESPAPPKAAAPENAPAGPRKETVPAVRGDRHATGGLKKPKLTEEELAEKMAEISIKNASLTAAHARAEADAASFAAREQQAKQVSEQRRKEERRDRQQMMGEREKNRQRKLRAMEGREWDAEKNEDEFGKGGRFDKKGGFAGDKEDYTDGREYLYREPKGSGRGGGAGRGGRAGRPQQQAAVPKQEDFPELPASANKSLDSNNAKPGKSWADQVEASPLT